MKKLNKWENFQKTNITQLLFKLRTKKKFFDVYEKMLGNNGLKENPETDK